MFLDYFQEGGPVWQEKINVALRKQPGNNQSSTSPGVRGGDIAAREIRRTRPGEGRTHRIGGCLSGDPSG